MNEKKEKIREAADTYEKIIRWKCHIYNILLHANVNEKRAKLNFKTRKG